MSSWLPSQTCRTWSLTCTSTWCPAAALPRQICCQTVRRWIIQADIDAGTRAGASTDEQAEIKRLKAENKRLREDNEILRSATVFFAGELDPRNR